MFQCPLGDCVSKENNAYVGLTTKTLSWQLKMHLRDSNSRALHLKAHNTRKSKFRKISLENTPIIAHKIDKLQLQIQEALHIKTKTKIYRTRELIDFFFNLLRTFCPHLGSFCVVSSSLRFTQISPLAFFRWFTATSDRNAESCNLIPSNYCLP